MNILKKRLRGVDLQKTLPIADCLAIIDMVMTAAIRHDINVKLSHNGRHRIFNISAYEIFADRLQSVLPDLTVVFDGRATISLRY